MAERPFSDIFYEQYLHEEKLMSSRCKKCGALYLPPRPICIECHDTNMEWEEIKGQGKLAAVIAYATSVAIVTVEEIDLLSEATHVRV